MTTSGKTSAIVVVGATGLVGEALLDKLAEQHGFGVEVIAVASKRSAGKRLAFGDRRVKVLDLEGFEFAAGQLVLLAVPKKVALRLMRRLAAVGVMAVVDFSNSDPTVPAALPWVAAGTVAPRDGLLRAPTALVVQLATSLGAVSCLAGVRRVHVHCLQPASARGQSGVQELAGQTASLLNVQGIESKVFPAQIAFNVLPHFDEAGVTAEVEDLAALTGVPADAFHLSRITVPVFFGQTLHVDVELDAAIDEQTLLNSWREIPALDVLTETTLSPVTDGVQTDGIGIGGWSVTGAEDGGSRLRYWSVVDNVRFSAAANGIAISDILVKPTH